MHLAVPALAIWSLGQLPAGSSEAGPDAILDQLQRRLSGINQAYQARELSRKRARKHVDDLLQELKLWAAIESDRAKQKTLSVFPDDEEDAPGLGDCQLIFQNGVLLCPLDAEASEHGEDGEFQCRYLCPTPKATSWDCVTPPSP